MHFAKVLFIFKNSFADLNNTFFSGLACYLQNTQYSCKHLFSSMLTINNKWIQLYLYSHQPSASFYVKLFSITITLVTYFPGGASGKEPSYQYRIHKRHGFNAWVSNILWRRSWQSTPVFLAGESHGQRSLAGYSPQGHKESDVTEATQHDMTVVLLATAILPVCLLYVLFKVILFLFPHLNFY